MKFLLSVILLIILSACASADSSVSPQGLISDSSEKPDNLQELDELHLKNHGLAPELTNQVWLNTDHPLRLADLKGKVVLIEMWTFG